MKKIFITLIITILLITGTNSVFALTDSDKTFLLEFIKTYNGNIVSEYGTELFENVEKYQYILAGYYPWSGRNHTSFIFTNSIPTTNSSTINSIFDLAYGNNSELTYGYMMNLTSTPTIGEKTTNNERYTLSNNAIFYLGNNQQPMAILNTDLYKNGDVYIQGGRQNTNFLNFIHNYENNTLEIAFGKNTSSLDYKPSSITVNYYDTSGMLITNEIITIDYDSSNYDSDKNTYTYDLVGTHFFGGSNVPLKRIINVSAGTNWYQKWTSESIDWNENPGSSENPPSGGSSSITGTGTGTSTGTVDENGNVTIDNSINIDLDTTPITDNMDQNTQEIINKLEEEPSTTEDDFKNNFVNTEIDDPSDDFFTWIFDNLENIFLSTEEQTLEFSLFTDNVYEISTNQITVPDGILKTLVGLSCDFGISYWILKDVRKTINKVKEGNIESLAEEDITANMV